MYMYICIYGCIDGWMDGRVDEWTGGWIYIYIYIIHLHKTILSLADILAEYKISLKRIITNLDKHIQFS